MVLLLKKMNWRDNIETVQRDFYDFENSNKEGVGMAQIFQIILSKIIKLEKP